MVLAHCYAIRASRSCRSWLWRSESVSTWRSSPLYKAFIARPLDARDPDTLVNLSLRLQSGATDARFSYPDYEAYRDGLRSFSGVIAFSIEQH